VKQGTELRSFDKLVTADCINDLTRGIHQPQRGVQDELQNEPETQIDLTHAPGEVDFQ
jgi:hypothetical protein